MAKIVVCDVCHKPLDGKELAPFDYRKTRLYIPARIHDPREGDWRDADLCKYCLIDALYSQDDRPKAG